MTIHHATAKKAAKLGFTIIEQSEDQYEISNGSASASGDSAQGLLSVFPSVAATLASYPGLALTLADGEYTVAYGDNEYSSTEEDDVSALIATALEEAAASGDLDETDAEDAAAEDTVRSIVPLRYRNEYKERGDATRCSDELCEVIDPWCTVYVPSKSGKGRAKRKGDVVKTRLLVEANGVTKDWPHLNAGQRAMNARNMLRSIVIETGVVKIPSSLTGGELLSHTMSNEWLASKRKTAKVAA
jgi:hypothetical protein